MNESLDTMQDELKKIFQQQSVLKNFDEFWHSLNNVDIVSVTEDTDEPLILEYDFDHADRDLIVMIHPSVRATIFDHRKSDSVQNGTQRSFVFCGEKASVNFMSLTRSADSSNYSDQFSFFMTDGSALDFYLGAFAGELVNTTIDSYLEGTGAHSNLNIALMNAQNDRAQLHVTNHFLGSDCSGEILMRSVGADRAQQTLDGMIYIGPQGARTDSYLKIDSILLNKGVKVNAKPNLEIKTNDVKAGHGASISRLNDSELFYLAARGISPEEARKMIIDGFLKDVFSKEAFNDTLREPFFEAISHKQVV